MSLVDVTDAYAHVGLPRFQAISDYEAVAEPVGVARTVLCAFDASPDLATLHDLAHRAPDRYRALGVPFGTSATEREQAVRAQLRAGFAGVRLTDRDIAGPYDVLTAVGDDGGIAFVVGSSVSTTEGARALLDHLDRFPGSAVVGGHFAGPREAEALRGPVAELFGHPRFHVVFSRHGGFEPRLLDDWAAAIIELTGWERVMWGSESPVLHWRDETLESALAWVDRLAPSLAERAAFLSGNAARLFFATTPEFRDLELPGDPWSSAPVLPAMLFSNGWAADQELAGRLMRSWAASPERSATLGAHVTRLLDGLLRPS